MSTRLPNLSWLYRRGDGDAAAEAPPPARRARVEESNQPPPSPLMDLPDELWRSILTAVETGDNPCDEVVRLCMVKREWAQLCREGVIFDAANLRLGWYGIYQSWAEVQQHYVDAGQGAQAPATPREYFKEACRTRAKVMAIMKAEKRAREENQSYVRSLLRGSVNNRFAVNVHSRLMSLADAHGRALAEAKYTIRALLKAPAPPYDTPYGAAMIVPALQANGRMIMAVENGHRARPNNQPPLPRNFHFDDLARIAVKSDGAAMYYAKDGISSYRLYDELSRIAVRTCGNWLEFIPADSGPATGGPEDEEGYNALLGLQRSDFGALAEAAVRQNGHALQFVPKDRPDFGRLAKLAVQAPLQRATLNNSLFHDTAPSYLHQDPDTLFHNALSYVPTDRADFGAIAKLAVQTDGLALEFVPQDRDDFGELARLAVQQNGAALFLVPGAKLVEPSWRAGPYRVSHHYYRFAGADSPAQLNNPRTVSECAGPHQSDFCELAALAVANNGFALEYIFQDRCAASYMALARTAVQQNGLAIQFVADRRLKLWQEQVSTPEYEELVALALTQTRDALWVLNVESLGFTAEELWAQRPDPVGFIVRTLNLRQRAEERDVLMDGVDYPPSIDASAGAAMPFRK